MRLLQFSDPHLLADPGGRYRDRRPWLRLRGALEAVLPPAPAAEDPPDLLLISGDLCQDESWGGYARLRELLAGWPTQVALLPGNHDHPQLLRAALGRRASIAPALIKAPAARLLLLSSHRPGRCEGWLGPAQLSWLEGCLAALAREPVPLPLLVAVHHPPVPIGAAVLDAIGLADGRQLLERLAPVPTLVGLVFGHVHQYWQGALPDRPDVPLLGCPSTLCGFGPVQPCPLGRPQDPGGLWLELGVGRPLQHRLLRCPAPGDGPA